MKELRNDEDWCEKRIKKIKIGLNKYYQTNHGGFKNKKHNKNTIKKMSESHKGMGIGLNNSQYGTCWITKDGINKKIKKELLFDWVNNGWIKGRYVKSIIPDEIITELKNKIKLGYKYSELEKMYGFPKSTIHDNITK